MARLYDDRLLLSEEAPALGLQDLARCGQCAVHGEAGRGLTDEEAALQWVRCAQCRCGSADWYRR